MEVISRAAAKVAGLKRYFTGVPCKHGHVAERLVGNGACRDCANAACRAYAERNADRERARKLAYRALNVERGRETRRAWRKRNYERYQKQSRAWYEANKERAFQAARAWQERNPARKRESIRAWQIKNVEKVRLYSRTNSHRRRAQQSGGMSSAEFSAWSERQPKACHWCGKKCAKEFHVDHYVPLSKGGEHVESNLVIACPSCNLRKQARDPYEFAAQVGRLF